MDRGLASLAGCLVEVEVPDSVNKYDLSRKQHQSIDFDIFLTRE